MANGVENLCSNLLDFPASPSFARDVSMRQTGRQLCTGQVKLSREKLRGNQRQALPLQRTRMPWSDDGTEDSRTDIAILVNLRCGMFEVE